MNLTRAMAVWILGLGLPTLSLAQSQDCSRELEGLHGAENEALMRQAFSTGSLLPDSGVEEALSQALELYEKTQGQHWLRRRPVASLLKHAYEVAYPRQPGLKRRRGEDLLRDVEVSLRKLSVVRAAKERGLYRPGLRDRLQEPLLKHVRLSLEVVLISTIMALTRSASPAYIPLLQQNFSPAVLDKVAYILVHEGKEAAEAYVLRELQASAVVLTTYRRMAVAYALVVVPMVVQDFMELRVEQQKQRKLLEEEARRLKQTQRYLKNLSSKESPNLENAGDLFLEGLLDNHQRISESRGLPFDREKTRQEILRRRNRIDTQQRHP